MPGRLEPFGNFAGFFIVVVLEGRFGDYIIIRFVLIASRASCNKAVWWVNW